MSGQDEQQQTAIAGYTKRTGRVFTPGEIVEVPVDALVFTEHQRVWTTLENYQQERCNYDPETNDWLVWLVTEFLLEPQIPPIYLDILPDGIALVDGAHRVTGALIAGRDTVRAHLNLVD